jgi:hypothetical protein
VVPVKTASSTAGTTSTNETAKSQSAAPGPTTALYPSPTESIDPLTSQLVLEYRNSSTGEEQYQTPSKEQLRLYQLSQSHTTVPGEAPAAPGQIGAIA